MRAEGSHSRCACSWKISCSRTGNWYQSARRCQGRICCAQPPGDTEQFAMSGDEGMAPVPALWHFSATGGDGSGSLGAPAAQRVLLCFWGWTSAPHPGPPSQPCSGTCSPHSRCDCGDVPSERQMCVTIITGQEMHPQGLRECTEINPALRATSSGAQLRLLPSVPSRISPAMKMNPFLLCG